MSRFWEAPVGLLKEQLYEITGIKLRYPPTPADLLDVLLHI
jgi:hypothetical protein